MDELSGPIMPTMNELFGRLEAVARMLDPLGAADVPQIISNASCTHWCFVRHLPFAPIKPLGYAGDYEMVNMI